MRWVISSILIITLFQARSQESSYGIQNASLKTAVLENSLIIVESTYDLILDDTAQLRLKYLNFESSQIDQINTSVNGTNVDLDFTSNNKLSSTTIDLGGENSHSLRLSISYQIQIDWFDNFDLILPVIYPDIKAANADQEFFRATLEVHQPYSMFEAFPSASWNSENQSTFATHKLTLQAVPSMIKLKLGKGDKPFFSTLRIVDTMVIIVLLMLLGLGWKKIKEV